MRFIEHQDGPEVCLEKSRGPDKLTPAQLTIRRYAIWLHAVEHGMFDPSLGCVRPYTVHDIADLWGVTARSVRRGLESAIALNAELRTMDG